MGFYHAPPSKENKINCFVSLGFDLKLFKTRLRGQTIGFFQDGRRAMKAH
jgi:hypothetical protein